MLLDAPCCRIALSHKECSTSRFYFQDFCRTLQGFLQSTCFLAKASTALLEIAVCRAIRAVTPLFAPTIYRNKIQITVDYLRPF